jgi:glycogen debranching enzyme
MPIRWAEPFGLVMTEAMACGTPVIAFAEGSAPELVTDGETGYDASVARWRHRDPRRRKHRDLHSLTRMGRPLGSIANLAETIVIKDGNVFMVTLRDGRLPADVEHPLGLWFRDCRFLCAHELRICGQLPRLLTATDAAGVEAVHELTNPDLELPSGGGLPAESLRIRVERRVRADGELRQRIVVRSYHRQPIELPLELKLDADFEPMLELRGIVPRHERPARAAGVEGFSAVGRDGVRRTTSVRATPEPRWADDGSLLFALALPARGGADVLLDLGVSESGDGETAAVPPRRDHRDGTQVAADDQLFNRVLRRSLSDLELLRSELDGQSFYAAGIPWFATLFGRDSLITAFQTISFVPGIAEGTLRLLAGRLGREYDDARDEEPGKVLHELRVGEPATLGETPFARYYGSVDATPLFLCLLCRHADWSGSLDLFRELRGPAEAALEWIDRYGDLDGDGLVEYLRRSPHGLVTQGWKDSADGIPDDHGEPLVAPVALVEVQGYVIRAKRLMARMFELDGDGARAERLRAESAELEARLERFWIDDPGCYAIGLDADKRPGSGLTSNQGHLLWCDAVSDERARAIRDVLMGPDMFSGWGIRTLAESHPAYNPIGYHTGSVWPHDSALIAFGLRRYGFDEDFTLIFEGLLEAASRFGDYRLPELFAGFRREEFDEPVPYPVACQPQAWAAGSIPSLLKWGLGLSPDALNKRLRVVRPSLPRWLERVEVTGLELGSSRIDLRFERAGEHVTLADARIDGDAEVILEIAGDRRRITDP